MLKNKDLRMFQPNLFRYATTELSQDAIICYILEWAKVENKVNNENLHNLAIEFIDSLFDKFSIIPKPTNYTKIEIKKQYKKIDILCIINDEYSIIIEDKTNTKNHSDQLKRYKIQIKEDLPKTQILPIYFKTGDQSDYNDVIKNGYKVYLRQDFLEVLNTYSTDNNIIDDYKNYLQNIEDSINSYKILPINQWHWDSWKGFFIELRKKLNDGNWDYISNPNGGFLGFWWNWNNNKEYHIYLQINHSISKITFKLYTKTSAKIEKSIINKWKKDIVHNDDDIIINKPRVVRSGKSVTIGILENEFRQTNNDNIIDMDETIKFIKKIEDIKLDKFKGLK